MPKRQNTAAQMARLRQAGTGEKYTAALRAVQHEEFEDYATGCCELNAWIASDLQARLDQGGVPALLAKLEELQNTMLSRSPHYDVYSGHGVLTAVRTVCNPLVYRTMLAGIVTEPLPEGERRHVSQAVRKLEEALGRMAAEELRD